MKQLNLFGSNEEPVKSEKNIADTFLGPKTVGMSYSQYLRSTEWDNKRKYALRMAKFRCQECGNINVPLQVHHYHYDSLFHERLKDVAVLCVKCHKPADQTRDYNTAHATYAEKVYGEDWYSHDEERLKEEFDDWLERKQDAKETGDSYQFHFFQHVVRHPPLLAS